MAWERDLFAFLDDLEGLAEAQYDAARVDELADRGRAEYREVTLAARLAASVGREVAVEVTGVGAVRGRLERVASGWFLVRAAGQDWLVRTAAVGSVEGTSERALPEVAWPAVARLGLASALRRLADAAEPCTVHLLGGGSHRGTIRRVGADFVELVTGERERMLLVAVDGLAAVRSLDPAGL